MTHLILEQDDSAREYVFRGAQRGLPSFSVPLFLICLPVSVLVSYFLYVWDSGRPYAWIYALILVPGMWLILKGIPYLLLVFRDRWVLGKGAIKFRGSEFGSVRSDQLTGWKVADEIGLDGYYTLSITTKSERKAILLKDATYPREEIELQMSKFYAESGPEE